MYLTVRLLDAGKKVRAKAELVCAARDVGPDICVHKGKRRIWIEAVSPDQVHRDNPDKVADLLEDGRINDEDERRRVELRITTAHPPPSYFMSRPDSGGPCNKATKSKVNFFGVKEESDDIRMRRLDAAFEFGSCLLNLRCEHIIHELNV